MLTDNQKNIQDQLVILKTKSLWDCFIGKCDTCKHVKVWVKKGSVSYKGTKCADCKGELKRTTLLCKYPIKANI